MWPFRKQLTEGDFYAYDQLLFFYVEHGLIDEAIRISHAYLEMQLDIKGKKMLDHLIKLVARKK